MQEYSVVSRDGEVLDLTVGLVAPRRAKMRRDFIMMFQDGLIALSFYKFNGTTLRVLLCLLGWTDYQNKVGCTQVAIAGHLDIKPSQVSKAFSELAKQGVISRVVVPHRQVIDWYVNPTFGWRGSPRNYASAAAKAPQGIPN